MSRERVVVVLEYRIYVYNFAGGRPYLGYTSAIPHLGYTSVHIFADLNLLHTIETISNPRGLCSLCADSRACVIACCGLQKGHVRAELFDITRTTLISAHEASLSCIALSSYAMRHHTLWCNTIGLALLHRPQPGRDAARHGVGARHAGAGGAGTRPLPVSDTSATRPA